jgi:DNA-binding transcriptional ArsR family regulator
MGSDRAAPDVAKALADPLRLAILARLLDGAAPVAELMSATGASQSNVSNHLALLRRRRLVRGARQGRQVVYRLAEPSVGQLIEALLSLGDAQTDAPRGAAPLALARTCYDHLAGRLGVAILDSLARLGAVSNPGITGVIEMGPRGRDLFGRLGVDVAGAAERRRRFAFACQDWTERRAHLGGSLGAALCRRFIEAGWVQPQQGTRAVLLTASGRRTLRRFLHLGKHSF